MADQILLTFSVLLHNNKNCILTKFEQNPYSSFWEKVENPLKNAHFRILLMNKNFFGKSGFVNFEPVSISNFMQKIRKILRGVFEICDS